MSHSKTSARYLELAKSWLAKLSSSTVTVHKLQEELLDESVCCIKLQEESKKAVKWVLQEIEKEWRKKLTGRGGADAWPEWIIQIILELLLHRTPPSCIPTKILTVAKSLHPNNDVIRELPVLRFVRECQSVLTVVTKTLAAYQLGQVDSYK